MAGPLTATRGLALLALLFMSYTSQCSGALQFGFYKGKCKNTTVDVENVILDVVKPQVINNPSLVAALLRLQFHDCFVHGCDASILLDGTSSEKKAGANGSVRGYQLIDDVKTALEKVCPGVVSCADIIIVSTKIAVSLTGGKSFEVQTGRRDGNVSRASDVDLPSPEISVSDAIGVFARKKLNVTDVVLLLGGHTVGVTHCSFIQDRLYNFKNSGTTDPSMNPTFAQLLMKKCPSDSIGSSPIPLNANTPNINLVDSSYYKQLMARRGVLTIDQELWDDSRTKDIVRNLASDPNFLSKFNEALVKLGTVEVSTGTKGEIRNSCRRVNAK